MKLAHYLPLGSKPTHAFLNINHNKDNIKSIIASHKRQEIWKFSKVMKEAHTGKGHEEITLDHPWIGEHKTYSSLEAHHPHH